jgi:hypothetical protein
MLLNKLCKSISRYVFEQKKCAVYKLKTKNKKVRLGKVRLRYNKLRLFRLMSIVSFQIS